MTAAEGQCEFTNGKPLVACAHEGASECLSRQLPDAHAMHLDALAGGHTDIGPDFLAELPSDGLVMSSTVELAAIGLE